MTQSSTSLSSSFVFTADHIAEWASYGPKPIKGQKPATEDDLEQMKQRKQKCTSMKQRLLQDILLKQQQTLETNQNQQQEMNNNDCGWTEKRIERELDRLVEEQQQQQQQQKEPTTAAAADLQPLAVADYRAQNGPHLSYLWLDPKNHTDNDDFTNIHGQTLYLGGNEGEDGKIYYIPGHALKVLVCDPTNNDTVTTMGPTFEGKFKWLRGVHVKDTGCIYGLPCHSDTVLKINVRTQTVTTLPIQYNESNGGHQEQFREWKYHGGSILPSDGCIYAIPQSAHYVLRVDPKTDLCTLVGPKVEGRYKWYGGVLGKTDHCIYGIPHDSPHILRICSSNQIELHGEFGTGGHKWHGAAAATNDCGDIVCVPANANQVLVVRPAQSLNEAPQWSLLGDESIVQSGRHRNGDQKYKFLGAIECPFNNRVYCFPSGSEHVLEIDTTITTTTTNNNTATKTTGSFGGVVRNIGPNLLDTQMERLCQNKWQNGIHLGSSSSPDDGGDETDSSAAGIVYGIPLAAETVLKMDCRVDPPVVTTWLMPPPHHKGLAKFEGAVVSSRRSADGGIVAYTVPNNHKAILRIETAITATTATEDAKQQISPANTTTNALSYSDSNGSSSTAVETKKSKEKRVFHLQDEPPGGLPYTSGIPTLRSSTHRVKYDLKMRQQSAARPKNKQGQLTKTTWLPSPLLKEDVFDYDPIFLNNLQQAVIRLLQRCDPTMVGHFRTTASDKNDSGTIIGSSTPTCTITESDATPPVRLEDFVIPVPSTWRTVNGGQCEGAQKYLSDQIENDHEFLAEFDRFVEHAVLPYLKQRLVAALEEAANTNASAAPMQQGQHDDNNESSTIDNNNDSNKSNNNNNDCNKNKNKVEDESVGNSASTSNSTVTFYYQRPPTIRLQPGPARSKVKEHKDSEYGHQNGEINFWIPLTDRSVTQVDLWCESDTNKGDFHPIAAYPGQVIAFHGSSCGHFVNTNVTPFTRVSMDFRVGVQGYFDPFWCMRGTTNDHGRREIFL